MDREPYTHRAAGRQGTLDNQKLHDLSAAPFQSRLPVSARARTHTRVYIYKPAEKELSVPMGLSVRLRLGPLLFIFHPSATRTAATSFRRSSSRTMGNQLHARGRGRITPLSLPGPRSSPPPPPPPPRFLYRAPKGQSCVVRALLINRVEAASPPYVTIGCVCIHPYIFRPYTVARL